MAHLFCVICRDGIPIQPQDLMRSQPDQDTPSRSDITHITALDHTNMNSGQEDFMVTTTCGHIFHNNCLQSWFKVEETNERNLFSHVYLLRETEDGVFTAHRVFHVSCPYCKVIFYARDCVKLYPIEVPPGPALTPETVVSTSEIQKMHSEMKELQQKLEHQKVEIDTFEFELKQLNQSYDNATNEHSEIEEKWIKAMRVLDANHQATKRFYTGILEAMGFRIPAIPAPDLSVADLIGQVIENREIVLDESMRPTMETVSLQANSPATMADSSSGSQSAHGRATDNIDAIRVRPEIAGPREVHIAANVGDKVVWARSPDHPMVGIVKWIGVLRNVSTAGVEFEKPIGQNEQLIKKLKALFPCKTGYGRLVPIAELVRFEDFSTRSMFRSRTTARTEVSQDLDFSAISEMTPDPIYGSLNLVRPDGSVNTNAGKIKSNKSKRFRKFLRGILPTIRWK